MTTTTDRDMMRAAINDCPSHLYTYTPEPGDTRWVFTDKVCLTLAEAYDHARLAPFTRAQIGALARGFEFVEADANARMVVTSVSATAVSYKHVGANTTRARFWMDRPEFEARYMGGAR